MLKFAPLCFYLKASFALVHSYTTNEYFISPNLKVCTMILELYNWQKELNCNCFLNIVWYVGFWMRSDFTQNASFLYLFIYLFANFEFLLKISFLLEKPPECVYFIKMGNIRIINTPGGRPNSYYSVVKKAIIRIINPWIIFILWLLLESGF